MKDLPAGHKEALRTPAVGLCIRHSQAAYNAGSISVAIRAKWRAADDLLATAPARLLRAAAARAVQRHSACHQWAWWDSGRDASTTCRTTAFCPFAHRLPASTSCMVLLPHSGSSDLAHRAAVALFSLLRRVALFNDFAGWTFHIAW